MMFVQKPTLFSEKFVVHNVIFSENEYLQKGRRGGGVQAVAVMSANISNFFT